MERIDDGDPRPCGRGARGLRQQHLRRHQPRHQRGRLHRRPGRGREEHRGRGVRRRRALGDPPHPLASRPHGEHRRPQRAVRLPASTPTRASPGSPRASSTKWSRTATRCASATSPSARSAYPATPPASIAFVHGKHAFVGDTLFPGGPGNSRTHETLLQEIESITTRLYALPDETIVWPGHGDRTTIGASKAEYAVFASRKHDPDLHGDVLWLES